MVSKKKLISDKTEHFWLKSLLILLLCVIAGFIGAKLQALKAAPVHNKPVDLITVNNTALNQLSDEIGQLKGRILAIETIRNSLTRAAGIEDKLAEILDESKLNSKQENPNKTDNNVTNLNLDSLHTQLDDLQNHVAFEEDLSYFMDLSLSEQTGFHASLPTFAPVTYPSLSSSFGWRKNPVSGRNTMHEGLDFAAPWGTPINASSGGIVVHAGRLGAYGNMVEIDHGNGLSTRYAHVSKINVKVGDLVKQGQQIANVGSTGRSTGAHLHFEVRIADYPLDPSLFIDENHLNTPVIAKNDIPISANKS